MAHSSAGGKSGKLEETHPDMPIPEGVPIASGHSGKLLLGASRANSRALRDQCGERYYGLGTISGTLNGWDWFGHSGGLQGYITRTCVIPQHDLTVAVLTNAIDGWAGLWVDGVMHILRAFSQHGAPSRKVSDWSGRWWSLWSAVDLVPMGD